VIQDVGGDQGGQQNCRGHMDACSFILMVNLHSLLPIHTRPRALSRSLPDHLRVDTAASRQHITLVFTPPMTFLTVLVLTLMSHLLTGQRVASCVQPVTAA